MLAQNVFFFLFFGVILVVAGVILIIYVIVKSARSHYNPQEIQDLKRMEKNYIPAEIETPFRESPEKIDRKSALLDEWERLDQERIEKEVKREEHKTREPQEGHESDDSEIKKKLRELISVSNRVKINMVISILEINENIFYKNIINWANQFNFRIDGEYLVFKDETISEFIDELDDLYSGWKKGDREKKETYKEFSKYSQI